jgi:hypothetical protein
VTIGPNCEHCGVRVREQYYKDEARPFEVQAGVYHSLARCRDHVLARKAKLERIYVAARRLDPLSTCREQGREWDELSAAIHDLEST